MQKLYSGSHRENLVTGNLEPNLEDKRRAEIKFVVKSRFFEFTGTNAFSRIQNTGILQDTAPRVFPVTRISRIALLSCIALFSCIALPSIALLSICTKPRNFFSRPDFSRGPKQVGTTIRYRRETKAGRGDGEYWSLYEGAEGHDSRGTHGHSLH